MQMQYFLAELAKCQLGSLPNADWADGLVFQLIL